MYSMKERIIAKEDKNTHLVYKVSRDCDGREFNISAQDARVIASHGIIRNIIYVRQTNSLSTYRNDTTLTDITRTVSMEELQRIEISYLSEVLGSIETLSLKQPRNSLSGLLFSKHDMKLCGVKLDNGLKYTLEDFQKLVERNRISGVIKINNYASIPDKLKQIVKDRYAHGGVLYHYIQVISENTEITLEIADILFPNANEVIEWKWESITISENSDIMEKAVIDGRQSKFSIELNESIEILGRVLRSNCKMQLVIPDEVVVRHGKRIFILKTRRVATLELKVVDTREDIMWFRQYPEEAQIDFDSNSKSYTVTT